MSSIFTVLPALVAYRLSTVCSHSGLQTIFLQAPCPHAQPHTLECRFRRSATSCNLHQPLHIQRCSFMNCLVKAWSRAGHVQKPSTARTSDWKDTEVSFWLGTCLEDFAHFDAFISTRSIPAEEKISKDPNITREATISQSIS